jgi:hypothetical protein
MSKYWVFTAHDSDVVPLWCDKTMTFLVYQLEKGETKEKLHWQGYVEFKKTMRLKAAQTEIGHKGAHMETRRGTAKQAYDYCTKNDTAVDNWWEFGEISKTEQGKRSDLDALAQLAMEGKRMSEVDKIMPGVMMKYDRNFARMRERHRKPRMFKTKVTVYWGATGIGKSRKVFEDAGEDFYSQRAYWWDGYEGQKVTVLDEIKNDSNDREFWLALFDRYPLKVPIKGSMAEFTSEHIIVSTCARPSWILEDPELFRRMDGGVWEVQALPGGELQLVASTPQVPQET